ncbi:MAG: hypothetical protein ACM30I_04140 [Gemmatimonas sp.]
MAEAKKELIDPYLDWVAAEKVPVHTGIAVDLLTVETRPWPRFGYDGAIIHLEARGDFVTLFLADLPPGCASIPTKHMYEQLVYVLSGHGSAKLEAPDGREVAFEWGPHSLFAIPLNMRYRLFNGSGRERARLALCNTFPLVYNYFMNERFVFDCPSTFPDRLGASEWFEGDGKEVAFDRGPTLWETNFVPDVSSFRLKPLASRGPGSSNIQFILGNGVMKAHVSAMPVGTYKKCHRHGPDFFIFNVTGSGYSLMWQEDAEDHVRVDWRHGIIFTPPDMWWHQHFNTSAEPARYLAMNLGNRKHPFTAERKTAAKVIGVSQKDGGRQIEYEDQAPWVHKLYLEELARHGAKCRMSEFMDESVLLRKIAATA